MTVCSFVTTLVCSHSLNCSRVIAFLAAIVGLRSVLSGPTAQPHALAIVWRNPTRTLDHMHDHAPDIYPPRIARQHLSPLFGTG